MRLLPILVAVLLLAGCTQRYNDLFEAYKTAIEGSDHVSFSADHINSIPYASMYITAGKAPRAFVALAYATPATPILSHLGSNEPLLTWHFEDSNYVVTQGARMIATKSFVEADVINLFSDQIDPVAQATLDVKQGDTYQWTGSWGSYFQYTHQATYLVKEPTNIDSPFGTLEVDVIEEQVYLPALDRRYTNIYYLDKITKKVMMSKQYIAPGLAPVIIQMLKPFRGLDT